MKPATAPRLFSIFLTTCCLLLSFFCPHWSAALAAQGRYSSSDAAGGTEGPMWNLWARNSVDAQSTTLFRANTKYTFSLDLARISYMQRASTPISSKLEDYLKNFRSTAVKLVVRPTIIDDSFRLIDDTLQSTITIDTKKLLPQSEDKTIENLLQLDPTKLNVALADKVRAGFYEVSLVPKRNGCATIGFSIWDDTGMYPLDHVIFTIFVGDSARNSAYSCPNGIAVSSIGSGLKTMLDVATSFKGGDPPVDGALYIFDTVGSPTHFTIATYIDRFQLKNIANHQNGEGGVYSWTLLRAPSEILSQSLVDRIDMARENAKHSNTRIHAYSDVAEELKKRLFPLDEPGAQRALSALKATARRSTPFAKILLRVISNGTDEGYLPLGLLAARSAMPILERQIMVVQPLPRPSYPNKERICIGSWSFGVPDTLDESTNRLPTKIDIPSAPWIRKRLSDREKLLQYLQQTTGVPESPSEGLLLLAHHDAGDVWFHRRGNSVSPEDIQRPFPPGSVAVLAACTTAGALSMQRQFTKQLNERGVDAIVMSPFPVPVPYAEQFTRDFATILRAERDKNYPAALLEIFQKANDLTVEYFRDNDQNHSVSDEMVLEFIVAGDYGLRLCTEPK